LPTLREEHRLNELLKRVLKLLICNLHPVEKGDLSDTWELHIKFVSVNPKGEDHFDISGMARDNIKIYIIEMPMWIRFSGISIG
jgi:hypothetical protein